MAPVTSRLPIPPLPKQQKSPSSNYREDGLCAHKQALSKYPPLRQPGCHHVARGFALQGRPWFAWIGAMSDTCDGQASKEKESKSKKNTKKCQARLLSLFKKKQSFCSQNTGCCSVFSAPPGYAADTPGIARVFPLCSQQPPSRGHSAAACRWRLW